MPDQFSLFGADDLPPAPAKDAPKAPAVAAPSMLSTSLASEPLAARMRPHTPDEIIGQEHLFGSGAYLAPQHRRGPHSVDDPLGSTWDASRGDRPLNACSLLTRIWAWIASRSSFVTTAGASDKRIHSSWGRKTEIFLQLSPFFLTK